MVSLRHFCDRSVGSFSRNQSYLSERKVGNDPIKIITNLVEQALQETIVIFPLCNDLLRLKPFVHTLSNFRATFLARSAALRIDCSSANIAQEIAAQAVSLYDNLPDEKRIQEIVTNILETSLPKLEKEEIEKQSRDATRILVGLTDFMVEQSTGSALTKSGLHKAKLWEQKCIAINNTPGLSISLDNPKFENIKGLHLRNRCPSNRTFWVPSCVASCRDGELSPKRTWIPANCR